MIQNREKPEAYFKRAKNEELSANEIAYYLENPPDHWSEDQSSTFARIVLAHLIRNMAKP